MRQSYEFVSGQQLMPVPSMPSLPPRDGVDAQIYAGIRAGALTVSAINRHTHVVGTSLPLPPTGEHSAIGSPIGTFLLPPRALCKHGGGMSTSKAAQLLARVDGTLAHILRGINAISFPSPLCAIHEHGGECVGSHQQGQLNTVAKG